MTQAKRDDNRVPTLIGVSESDGITPTLLEVDPNTGELLVKNERVSPFDRYLYMGKQTAGDYYYYGFKEQGGTDWYIARYDTTDDSAWAYAYSSSGGNDWSTAWADPGSESFGDPPDS